MNKKGDNGKLRTFVTFKKNLRLENYLMSNIIMGRSFHSSLRSGTNVLEIEQGRWKKISRDHRLCNICDSKQVETEKHFILACSRYQVFRNTLYQLIFQLSNGKWDLANRNQDEVFILL